MKAIKNVIDLRYKVSQCCNRPCKLLNGSLAIVVNLNFSKRVGPQTALVKLRSSTKSYGFTIVQKLGPLAPRRWDKGNVFQNFPAFVFRK